MTTIYQATDIIGPGNAINAGSGDTVVVARNANVVSTQNIAIQANGNFFGNIFGNVYGGNGISSIGAGLFSLMIGDTGTVTGAGEAYGMNLQTAYSIVNHGEVTCMGSNGWAFYASSSGSFVNYGSVSGGYGFVLGGNSTVSHSIINFGDITGTTTAIAASSGAERVVNHGVIQGSVFLNGGNDTFVVAEGRLYGTLDGGSGSDTISFEGFGRGIIADMAVGLTWDGQRNQVISNVENATGGIGNDIFFGSAGDNIFDPGSMGVDQINGYGGNDTVSYVSSIRSMIIDLTAGATWDGAEGDTLSSIENAIGSRFNDTIYGTSGDNVIDGGPEGADTLFGLGGIDTISYVTSETGVIVDMNVGASWDGFNGDTISGFENVTGSAFNDSIYADGGNNVIVGGRGFDTIYTGAGADRVVAASIFDLSAGRDIIADFTVGQDKMIFNISDGYLSTAGFVASAAPAASTGAAAFLYNTSNGFLSYDADGNGAGAAVTVASFTNLPTLGLSDFIFV